MADKKKPNPEALARTTKRLAQEAYAKSGAVPAREDTDKTAKPLTRLVGHVQAGQCVGPTTRTEDLYLEDAKTGDRYRVR